MTWWIVGGIAGVVVLIAAVAFARRSKPLVSIVMLRPKPADLTEACVRGAARRVIDPRAEVRAFELPDGAGIGYGIAVESRPVLLVINAKRPYCDDPAAESLKFENP